MTTEDAKSPPTWEDKLRKALPGLLVMVAVLILVKGVGGTIAALWLQAATLVDSFFGGGDAMAVVMLHTSPLALSAGIASFAIARGWLTFESFQSVIALALMVLAGASLGGTLRQLAPPAGIVNETDSARATAPSLKVMDGWEGNGGGMGAGMGGIPLAIQRPQSQTQAELGERQAQPVLAPKTPWRRFTETNWLATPNLKQPPKQIEPLAVLPEPGGVLTLIAKAVNMLLGYLVGYQPRLFLAAVLVGAWTGWKWHQKLAEWERAAQST